MKNLPKGWKEVVSSEIMDIRDGTHNTPKYVSENGIPLITSKNLKGNKIDFQKVNYISMDDHEEISKRSKVEKGDILFAMIGTIGNPVIIKENYNFSIKNVGLFKKNEIKILPDFLVNFLRSNLFEKQLNDRKLLKGTTQKFIPLGNLRQLQIPLPPLETQQRIVTKIEELFSELDKGVEELKKTQEQLKTYRQSVLKWAFEGRFTNENVKDGELPDGWGIYKIGEVCKTIDGDRGPNYPKKEEFSKIGYCLYLSTKNVREDKFLFEDNIYITKEKDDKLRSGKLIINDIVITTRGTLGNVALYDNRVLFEHIRINSGMLILRIENEYLYNFYLMKFISSPIFKNQLKKMQTGTAQPQIPVNILREIKIPIPPIEEQHQIVQEIESRLSVADKLEEQIKTSLQQAEALRQSILKKAFEGELVR